MSQSFNSLSLEKHIFTRDSQVDELLKDIIRFFNGTPIQPLAPKTSFVGAGVYALYYTGDSKLYQTISNANRISYDVPIYIGKAVPAGWRQGRAFKSSQGKELYKRLKDHAKSISDTSATLDINDFACRFVIFNGAAVGLIACVEAKMIECYSPVWNSCIDGFGNHDPGSGRYNQALSEWDAIHTGRPWANHLKGSRPDPESLRRRILDYLG